MLQQCMGEFFGTLFLLILGNGVVAAVLLKKSYAYQSGWMVITTGWFVAVVVGVFVAISAGSPNADINPAVSFTKFCLGLYPFWEMCYFMLAQLLGGFCGAIIVWLVYYPHWKITEDASHKLMVFSTQPAIRLYRWNFLTEMIATIVLVFGVAAIFGRATPTGPAPGLGPLMIGVLVWGIGLSLGGPTGYAINPARDAGPRLAHMLLPIPGKRDSDWHYGWIPIVAPLVGGGLGAWLTRGVLLT